MFFKIQNYWIWQLLELSLKVSGEQVLMKTSNRKFDSSARWLNFDLNILLK